jgi:serine/threonine protein kinase
MAQVSGHRNLVSIIGVITRGDPLVLVLQFCEHGSVLDKLKAEAAEGTPVTFASKMHMALDIATGMEHLASLRFIHRDLAARNVLVAYGKLSGGLQNAKTGTSLVCKIADFGLSRGGDGGIKRGAGDEASPESYYKSSNGVFPIRWTAPEAMESLRYTQASDVWSFGVVLVELMQDGTSPYHGQSNPAVMQLVRSGGRHPKPSADCTVQLFKLMLLCWHEDVARRPTFARIVPGLKRWCANKWTVSTSTTTWGLTTTARRVRTLAPSTRQREQQLVARRPKAVI